ncbi:2-oxoglutarate dehydrogenase E2 component (dihydrolipoamide succinyltransferase) [Flexibacter flexilis DSM 6793]|uniref:Dihydrolipoamide acetyltransferase component of pyruvate dehydrogenase complex n=1 Tax=Flexibacter flexilis DSM 6793 TaxID=927664 RepID=A0A1I1IZS4_9BACT|nr:dihydrolipoamide acetyltransferase family protein [Flexibacter flexilis]SFC41665.1 2-oxoglutarate dehydrogenase E2 component (dihydrolipoamide succinyltransferase) [Flexibacter flexilis DSM 6793]
MALIQMVMPKMGESIMEGTVLSWLKKVGDKIEQDEAVLEVATDKVDTEVPATHAGFLKEILVKEGDVVPVGSPIAVIDTEANGTASAPAPTPAATVATPAAAAPVAVANHNPVAEDANRFYSPLVMSIAREEKISMQELEAIAGTGKDNRVTKKDILAYVADRTATPAVAAAPVVAAPVAAAAPVVQPTEVQPVSQPAVSYSGAADIIEMDRMRKMISQRMVDSKRISPHVTSFVEADVTNVVYWRNRVKNEFKSKEGDAITFTPIFIEAVARAIKDYPMINASVEGDKIIVKKDINIGMAVALPSGNLIVPVIRNADQLNIVGLTKRVNDLARRARENKLTPDDLSGGTFTVSNVGSFGNVMGTPIIMQPQIAILALGAIQKKPAVIETPLGDTIGIRHLMFLSHSYDHRVVDGSLGGMFVRRVADYLEAFDLNRKLF